jgi:hypothetical protein
VQVYHQLLQAVVIALEAACLLHWARFTFDVPLAAAGVSLGGTMAGLTAQMFNAPLAVVLYMAAADLGTPFTEGAHLLNAC